MLRKVAVILSVFVVTTAWAQQEQKNPYVEKMQQTFNQATNAANAEFNRKYPKPMAPVITGSKTPVQPQPVIAPPPAPKYVPPKPQEMQQPTPDKQAPPPTNIYVAPNNSTQNSNSTINPYR